MHYLLNSCLLTDFMFVETTDRNDAYKLRHHILNEFHFNIRYEIIFYIFEIQILRSINNRTILFSVY